MSKVEIRKAAVYVRRSKDRQVRSLEEQLTDIRKYARENGIEIIETFVFQDTKPGTSRRGRVALEAMLQAIKSGQFAEAGINEVLCWATDRLGRNLRDSLNVEHELSQRGVRLYSITEGYDLSSPSGRTDFYLRSTFAEIHNRLRGADTRRGQRAAMRAGACIGSAPYGYKKDQDGKLCISAPEAAVVRRCFSLLLQGYSPRRICTILNESGVRPPRARRWAHNCIGKLLRSETFIGIMIRGIGAKNERRDTALVEPQHHPAIIDTDTFIKAQRILAGRSTQRSSPGKLFFLLGGMGFLRCGRCQMTVYGMRQKTWNRRAYISSYRCSSRRTGKSCGAPAVRCDRLDRVVIDRLADYAAAPRTIQAAWKSYQRQSSSKAFPLKEEIRRFDDLLRSIAQRLNKLVPLCEEKKIVSRTLLSRIAELENQQDQLRIKRQEFAVKLGRSIRAMPEAEMMARLKDFRRVFDQLSPESQKMLVRTFVESIVLHDDRFQITVRFLPKPFTASLAEKSSVGAAAR